MSANQTVSVRSRPERIIEKRNIAGSTLLFLLFVFGLGVYPCNAQQTTEFINNDKSLLISGKVANRGPAQLAIEFSVENKSDGQIFVSIKPLRLYGESGFYITGVDEDNGAISLSSCVYADPPFFPYSDETSVELILLEPGGRFGDTITLRSPLKETLPPFEGGLGAKKRSFSIEKLNKVELVVGYFTEPNVGNVASRRVRGSTKVTLLDGSEKTLLELQKKSNLEIEL